MKIQVEIDATPTERRLFLGHPDITPMVELLSEMLDDVMLVVVEARLEELEALEPDTRTEVASPQKVGPAGRRRVSS